MICLLNVKGKHLTIFDDYSKVLTEKENDEQEERESGASEHQISHSLIDSLNQSLSEKSFGKIYFAFDYYNCDIREKILFIQIFLGSRLIG